MSGKCGMYPMRPCWDKDDYNKCRNNYDHHAHDDVHCDCDDKKKKEAAATATVTATATATRAPRR